MTTSVKYSVIIILVVLIGFLAFAISNNLPASSSDANIKKSESVKESEDEGRVAPETVRPDNQVQDANALAVAASKPKVFLEKMKADLAIEYPVIPTTVYGNTGFGFGSGVPAQSSWMDYVRTKLAPADGRYASEASMGYSDGEIVCIIQDMRVSVPSDYPKTTHSEIVCIDYVPY